MEEETTTLKINGKEYEYNVDEQLQIDTSDISEEFATHAGKFAYWAILVENASYQVDVLKQDLAVARAQLDAQKRAELKAAGKKSTEKMVENMVITDPQYLEKEDAYLDAKRTLGYFKAAKDAMIQRKDMLVSLGATQRAEYNSDISLRMDR